MDFAGVPVIDGGVARDAFHGTGEDNARAIIASKRFEIRSRAKDELGRAVYFYIGDPEAARAYANAAQYLAGHTAVVKATVALGDTLNSWLLWPKVEELKRNGPERMKTWTFTRLMLFVTKLCKKHIEGHRRRVSCVRFFRWYNGVRRYVLVLAVYDPSSVTAAELY